MIRFTFPSSKTWLPCLNPAFDSSCFHDKSRVNSLFAVHLPSHRWCCPRKHYGPSERCLIPFLQRLPFLSPCSSSFFRVPAHHLSKRVEAALALFLPVTATTTVSAVRNLFRSLLSKCPIPAASGFANGKACDEICSFFCAANFSSRQQTRTPHTEATISRMSLTSLLLFSQVSPLPHHNCFIEGSSRHSTSIAKFLAPSCHFMLPFTTQAP